jgi:hypothetical protein
MNAANSSSQPVAPLTLEETLEIPLLCFEAAADARPPFPFAYAIPVSKPPEGTEGVPSYLIWSVNDLDEPPSSSELSSYLFPPASLPAALARALTCDSFALLLEKEVDRLVNNFGAMAEWVMISPQPALATYSCHARSHLRAFSHSILVITLCDGTQWVMDGTGEQFGWPRSSWLLNFHQFSWTRVQWFMGLASDWHKQQVQDSFRNRNHGYWAVVQERMEELLHDLDWENLKALPREERVKAVKEQAEAKFAGAWDEAIAR